MRSRWFEIAVAGMLLAAACAPQGASRGASDTAAGPSSQARSVTILTRAEPPGLASPSLTYTGVSVSSALRPFNAQLVVNDGHDQTHPYLAEAAPQLNTDSWRVFPDGRAGGAGAGAPALPGVRGAGAPDLMETTYRLKPGLIWHDGTPLSAQDFAFGYKVYSSPEFGVSYLGDRVQSITAPDSRTIVVRWKVLYPLAGSTEGVRALPRHLLESQLGALPTEAFVALPYWSQEYVGLGPYQLERWEPGTFIQGVAFDGHALGRPKIDRVVIHFSADENTALANILSENVQIVADRSIRFEQVQVLREDWQRSNKGVTVLTPSMNRWMVFQTRPEYANPSALLDLKTRQAIVFAIDRGALNEGLFAGSGVMATTIVRPTLPYYADVDGAIVKYPYDPRRTEQLMGEVGYTKGTDGIFTQATGQKFQVQIMNQAGAQPERETAIMQETWRRAGFDVSANIVPVSQSRDSQARAIFPGLQNASGGSGTEDKLTTIVSSAEIGTPQNRWMGDNRGGWSNPDYDRLVGALQTTLEPNQRAKNVMAMERLISEQLPVTHLFFNFAAIAYLSTLDGPDRGVADDTDIIWNIHEWKFR